MAKHIPVRKCGDNKLSHVGLAIQIKKMLNDIIDVAYKDREETPPQKLGMMKRFTIFASEAELSTRLGDCRYNKDGSASIRILGLGRDRYQETLIVAIHEISHHIERSLYGSSGHSPRFYDIHKKLLYAAFDMGILSVSDVTNGESRARNQHKLAAMMYDYVPHPVDYKSDIVHVFVYDAFSVKDKLKAHGYTWNGLDTAWTRQVSKDDLNDEKNFLTSIGILEENIKCSEGGAVVTRLRKSAKLFNVPYEQNSVVRKLGYRWVDAKQKKYWQKKIDGDQLSAEEEKTLKAIKGIRIVID